MPSNIIMALNLDFYLSIYNNYHNTGFKGLGPSDEFIELYCMGSEL